MRATPAAQRTSTPSETARRTRASVSPWAPPRAPLTEPVVGGLPEGVEGATRRGRAHPGMSGEGGHRPPGQVRRQPPRQQRLVGAEDVAHGAEGAGSQGPGQVGQAPGQLLDRHVAPYRRQDGAHHGYRLVDEGLVGPGLLGAGLGDRVDGGLHRAVEAHPAPVGVHGDGEGVHLLVHEPGPGQVELGGDVGHVDDVVGHGVQVEAVAGNGLLGARPTAGTIELLEHHHLAPGPGQVAGGDEAVVAGPDHDHVDHQEKSGSWPGQGAGEAPAGSSGGLGGRRKCLPSVSTWPW